MVSPRTISTERLQIRPVLESDRPQLVDLFMDPDFMVYSLSGALDRPAANTRFDHMMTFSRQVAFGKQAIVEASTGSLVGYVGADVFEFGGVGRLEFGYRLVRVARGIGYATEAAGAMLEVAGRVWQGELLAFIDPDNVASRNVLVKTGFEFVEPILIGGDRTHLYRLSI